ncbi:ferric reductase like transmembrane component-domain-containing protein [Xylogone sp. PMI_703]|nr:ferric reductase like transmembrane component-domain-containing protein [Xylogone sp. PMI_703]
MSSSRFFILLLSFVSIAFAAKPLAHEVCAASCYDTFLKVKFAGKDPTACTNDLKVTSTFYCIRQHCTEADIEPGIAWWAASCKKSKAVVNVKAYRKAVVNVTDDFLDSLPTVNLSEKKVINTTVLPSSSSWDVVYTSVHTYDTQRQFNNRIRWIPYAFWAIVLLLGTANRTYAILRDASASSHPDSENGTLKYQQTDNGALLWIRKYILTPPTFGYRHHQPLGWLTVPLRLQSIVIGSYIIMHIALVSVHYPVYQENYYYDTTLVQHLRYFSDRIGTLTSSDLPWLWFFSARNNPFIYLTGWDYQTFNIFHRWVATVLLIESIVHGASFSAFYVNDSGWDEYHETLHERFFYCGILALSCLCVVAISSALPIRRYVYELFKVTHVAFAVLFLAAFHYHTFDQFQGKYLVFLWLCIGLWSAEHAARLVRLLVLNYKALVGKSTPAIVTYLEDAGMIRMQIFSSLTHLYRGPGFHYYVYLPSWRVWETHPFSLAGWSTGVATLPSPDDANITDLTTDEKTARPSTRPVVAETEQSQPSMTFLIRPRTGMTRRLLKSLIPNKPTAMKILLEGPYGTAAPLSRFNEILFLAGGSGITAVLPYIRRISEKRSSGLGPKANLTWIARERGFVEHILANELAPSIETNTSTPWLKTNFYITPRTADEAAQSPSATESDNEAVESRSPSTINWQYSKPNVDHLIRQFAAQHDKKDKVAVFICGPASMADDARKAIVKLLREGQNGLELFEEIYSL